MPTSPKTACQALAGCLPFLYNTNLTSRNSMQRLSTSSVFPVGFLIFSTKDRVEALNDLRFDHPDSHRLLAESLELDRQILATPARDRRDVCEKVEFLAGLLVDGMGGEYIAARGIDLDGLIQSARSSDIGGVAGKIARLASLLDPDDVGDYVPALAASCSQDCAALAG
jgi:hypothetical protein